MNRHQITLGFVALFLWNTKAQETDFTHRFQLISLINPFDFVPLPKKRIIESPYTDIDSPNKITQRLYESPLKSSFSIVKQQTGYLYCNGKTPNPFVIVHEASHVLLSHQQEKLGLFNLLLLTEYLTLSYIPTKLPWQIPQPNIHQAAEIALKTVRHNLTRRLIFAGLFIALQRKLELEADFVAESILRDQFKMPGSGKTYFETLKDERWSLMHPSKSQRIQTLDSAFENQN